MDNTPLDIPFDQNILLTQTQNPSSNLHSAIPDVDLCTSCKDNENIKFDDLCRICSIEVNMWFEKYKKHKSHKADKTLKVLPKPTLLKQYEIPTNPTS